MFDTFVQIKDERKSVLVPTLVSTWVLQGSYLGTRRIRSRGGIPDPTFFIHLEEALISRRNSFVHELRSGDQTLPKSDGFSETTAFLMKKEELTQPDRLRIDIRKADKSLCKGMRVVVTDDSLLSYNTKGTLLGFTKSRTGNILAHINYLEGCAPLTISVNKIEKSLPRKIWRVQRIVTDENNTMLPSTESDIQDRSFTSLRQAQRVANSLSQGLDGHQYVVLESIQVTTEFGLETYPTTH